MIKNEDEYFVFEHSDIDEIRHSMTEVDFDKEYGLIRTMPYECIKCDYYKHCRALRHIFKNREYKFCDNHNIKESNHDQKRV